MEGGSKDQEPVVRLGGERNHSRETAPSAKLPWSELRGSAKSTGTKRHGPPVITLNQRGTLLRTFREHNVKGVKGKRVEKVLAKKTEKVRSEEEGPPKTAYREKATVQQ